jgi:hypothetical protein
MKNRAEAQVVEEEPKNLVEAVPQVPPKEESEPVEAKPPVLTKDTGSEEKKAAMPSTIDIELADLYKHQLLVERVKSAQLTSTLKQHEAQLAHVAHQDSINKVNESVEALSKKYKVEDIGKYKLGDDSKLHLIS